MNPSRAKFRIAKRFVSELYKIYGNKLKLVLVCGSVGSNIATTKSDIDLVVAIDHKDILALTGPESPVNKLRERFEANGQIISPAIIKSKDVLKLPEKFSMVERAVPIFGSKKLIAQLLANKAFQYPSRKTIVHYYTKTQLEERTKAKRNKIRFKSPVRR